MALDEIENLRASLRRSGLKPKSYLGQNFLVDQDVLAEIMATADLRRNDVVLEVGPGLGILTGELVKRAGQVIAVEKDRELFSFLKKESREVKNLELVNQDILRFNLNSLPRGYKVVANIPYYLTSKLIQNFLTAGNQPSSMVMMIQKEVGERVVAAAGDLSILGLSVQLYADAEIAATISKRSFWPVPKVDSVILKIMPRQKYPEITDEKFFFRMLKAAFAGKRKQIHNTLIHGLKLPKEQILEALTQAGIEPKARPQDVSIAEWLRLYKFLFLCYNISKV